MDWLASRRTPPGQTLLPSHYGILFYVKNNAAFKFYDLRAPHVACRKCGEYAKDYGGKKHLRHPFGALVGDVWTDIHRIRHNSRRDPHPCQLPPHLIERLILMSTDAGDVVLDPFLGAGTTAIAAKRLGRRYVGVELSPQYAEIAKANIAAAKPSKYRGVFVSKFLDKIVTMRDVDANAIFGKQPTAAKRKSAALATDSAAPAPAGIAAMPLKR